MFDRRDPRTDDPRNRDRDRRERDVDPRDVFMLDLDLPRGREREFVHDTREREYRLRESEARTLSIVGAFRVVPAGDLRDHLDRRCDPRDGDLRHLREQGLVQTIPLDGRRDHVVVLTDRGRDLLEAHRSRSQEAHQTFYAGLRRRREAEHDAQVFQAYLREAERLAQRHAQVERVVLDYELKREYQRWLHERDRDRHDSDGRPDRDPREVAEWACSHDLPHFNGRVHFPDLRIEYVEWDWDERHDHRDVEIVTLHYRGAHAAAARRSGFSCHGGRSARIGGGGRGGYHDGLAEELLL